MREIIRAYLAGDSQLAGWLTGGIHAGSEITRQDAPDAYDAASELRPCALVRVSTETPDGPYPNSSRLFFQVLFYQRSGFGVIDKALARTFALLNGARIAGGMWEIRHSDDLLDQVDPALGCSLAISRYAMTRLR